MEAGLFHHSGNDGGQQNRGYQQCGEAFYHKLRQNERAVWGGTAFQRTQRQNEMEQKEYSITCADGKPFFFKEHPSKVDGVSLKQSNLFKGAFSVLTLDCGAGGNAGLQGRQGQPLECEARHHHHPQQRPSEKRGSGGGRQ